MILFDHINRNHCVRCKRKFVYRTISRIMKDDALRQKCRLFLCSHFSAVSTAPLCPLLLCSHCSSVPNVPLCSLFLCAHRSSVLTLPLCSPFLCARCSSVLAVPVLCPLCPLFPCALCSSMPTVTNAPPVPSVPLCLLFLCVYSSSVPFKTFRKRNKLNYGTLLYFRVIVVVVLLHSFHVHSFAALDNFLFCHLFCCW